MICKNGKLEEEVTLSACWTQRNQMDSFFNGEETYDTKGQKVIEFYFRDNGKLYCRKDRSKLNPPSVLRGIATTKQGSYLLKKLFNGKEPIGYVKPIELIKFLISLTKKNSTVLDFFAGSGVLSENMVSQEHLHASEPDSYTVHHLSSQRASGERRHSA